MRPRELSHAAATTTVVIVAAIAVFPLAVANLLFWVMKGAFACGFF